VNPSPVAARTTLHEWIVGFVLLILIVYTLMATAILFSTSSFQVFMQQVAPATGGLIDIRQLQRADSEISVLQAETAAPRGELIEVEQQVAQLESRTSAAQVQADEMRAALVQRIAELEASAGAGPAASGDLSAAALSERAARLLQRSLTPADQQSLARVRTEINNLATLEDTVAELDASRSSLVARQRLVGGQVAESQRRIYALQQSVVPEISVYNRVRASVAAIESATPMGVGATLIRSDPSFLQLVLAMASGALGGLLFLLPTFAARAYPVTLAMVVSRLVLGMVGGFAGLLISYLIFAGFSAEQSFSGLVNPFMVAFTGIAGGAIADEIATGLIARRLRRRIDLGIARSQ